MANTFWSKARSGMVLLAMGASLLACGGGGGDPTLDGVASSVPATLNVALRNPSGAVDNIVRGGAPLTVLAVVLDKNGRSVPGVLLSFSAPESLVTFSAKSALTDSSGAATVTMQSAGVAGAGELAVSASLDGIVLNKAINYGVVP